MITVGCKVETLVSTQYTERDPESISGINFFKRKYPKGTICTVTCVDKRRGLVYVVADNDTFTHAMDEPAYDPDHLREIDQSNN